MQVYFQFSLFILKFMFEKLIQIYQSFLQVFQSIMEKLMQQAKFRSDQFFINYS